MAIRLPFRSIFGLPLALRIGPVGSVGEVSDRPRVGEVEGFLPSSFAASPSLFVKEARKPKDQRSNRKESQTKDRREAKRTRNATPSLYSWYTQSDTHQVPSTRH